MNRLLVATLASVLGTAPGVTEAAAVQVTVLGQFFEGSDANNTLGLGVQTPVSLINRSVSVSFTYDTTFVPPSGSPGPGIFFYESPISDPWLSAPTIVIDGVTAPLPTVFANANGVPRKSISIQGGDPNFFTLFYQHGTVGDNGGVPGLGTFQVQFTIPIPALGPSLPAQSLELAFSPNQSGLVMLGDSSNTDGGLGTYNLAGGFSVSAARFEVAPVPLPSAGLMLGGAIVCVSAAARRKSRLVNETCQR